MASAGLPSAPARGPHSTGRAGLFRPTRFLLLAFFSCSLLLLFCLHLAVEDVASRTRTVAGHNMEATPWHVFPHSKEQLHPYTIFRCNYLSCPKLRLGLPATRPELRPSERECPAFFAAIHRDLEPWRKSRISASMVAAAADHAAMRVVILEGRRLFVELYYACVQSRMMFTVWGLLQLLRRYPGMVPDVDLMFDCMDRPVVNRSYYRVAPEGGAFLPPIQPPPLFRYCTTEEHLDIPFPDWSFWGWPEVNINPWDIEFQSIKVGSQAIDWKHKSKFAYWKGNPDVGSPIRVALLTCNDTNKWGAQILQQNWIEESQAGYQNSKLSNQCNHRYKIYAEGYAWSVSLKYIIACGSLSLIIQPEFQDFFTRGLVPKENYWPVKSNKLCQSIKSVVDWGNQHQKQAEKIGKKGQAFMQKMNMDRVYDYMYHLIVEYSKLQKFKPVAPSSAQEVCEESLLCVADEKQKDFLRRSYVSPAYSMPCVLPPPNSKE